MDQTLFDILSLDLADADSGALRSGFAARSASVASSLTCIFNSRKGLVSPKSCIGLPDVGDARRNGALGLQQLCRALREAVLVGEPRLVHPQVVFLRHNPHEGRIYFRLSGTAGGTELAFEVGLGDPGPACVTVCHGGGFDDRELL